jgi:hypothetical protein
MADYENSIFNNLPRRKRRLDDDDNTRSRFREALGMYEPEGPLPPRPHRSGVGGPSINQTPSGAPPPVNTVAPAASGTTTIGSTLSCTPGTWTNAPTSYAYQWLRGGTNISGATASTYVTVTADGGASVSCTVTATNTAGSASATSNALSIAAAATSVWSASDAAANSLTLSNGGLTVASKAGNWYTIRNTISKTAGKVYVEFLANTVTTPGNDMFGLANAGFSIVGGNYLGAANYSGGITDGANYVSAGFVTHYSTSQYPVTGDVWALAVDFAAGSVWVAQNNVWLNGSNPATGSLPILSFTPATVGPLFVGMSFSQPGDLFTLQPTAASQKYAPPSGFSPWG